jgi:hypothetical protein
MRDNFLVFVVRPAANSWEKLLLSTAFGEDVNDFDLPRARVPHRRDPDDVVRRYLADYDVEPVERLAVLGEELLPVSRRRTVYVYRAPDALPAAWSRPVAPPPNLKVPIAPIVAHLRFVDLSQPVPVGPDEGNVKRDIHNYGHIVNVPFSVAPSRPHSVVRSTVRVLILRRRAACAGATGGPAPRRRGGELRARGP